MHCDADVDHDKKAWKRELHVKALDEEFHFTDIPGSDSDSLIVPAKKHTNSDISDDLIKKTLPRF